VGGVKSAFIIDRYTNGKQSSRINYDSMEFNKTIPDSIFAKPTGQEAIVGDVSIVTLHT
jgi:outer membrane lipoprotein-sorting protein